MNEHAVQFYEDDSFLIKGMADYIGSALAAGDKGIAIATSEHLEQLEATLRARGLVDARRRATRGEYIPLEADQMISRFMENGVPNDARFHDAVGAILLNAGESHSGRTFICGEMIAIMYGGHRSPFGAGGSHDAALHMERYFNSLMRQHSFSLLCAYPLSAFPSAGDADPFGDVCKLHAEVLPAESYDPTTERDALVRTIASLQQQAYALKREVYDRKLVEQALREVNVDRLTGLPNRNVFQDRLEMDIKKSQRSGLPLALLFIDLDHFKEINDTRGHEIGDLLLKQVGQRLQRYVRESDTVARLGGDEFTITLTDLQDVDSVTDIAQKVRSDLARPFLLRNEMAYISASIGITLYPRDASNASELLRNADQAMYRSKEMGRNRFSYFQSSMQDAAQVRMSISNELRRAIDDGQLRVHYQPIVELSSGRVSKAEALLRWRTSSRGEISPVEFIPIAEHTGLIATIGNWVFRQALAQARSWRACDPRFTVNVNVSPSQFFHGDGEHCSNWLQDDHGRPQSLPEIGLEITEGLLLAANPAVLKQLMAFQQAGIKIALDDFGTGYSSLSYLRKFHLDFLKIDQSFVHNLELDAANLALCEAIIVMAHKLGLRVVAEGIETQAQADLLQRAGCDFGQGFLYGEAMAPDAFEGLLNRTISTA